MKYEDYMKIKQKHNLFKLSEIKGAGKKIKRATVQQHKGDNLKGETEDSTLPEYGRRQLFSTPKQLRSVRINFEEEETT